MSAGLEGAREFAAPLEETAEPSLRPSSDNRGPCSLTFQAA
jgi:hypothetical protein